MYTIQNIRTGIKNESKFKRAFSLLFQFVDEQGWSGACHPSVTVLFAICERLGIQAIPCIGETSINGAFFDHSWLLINGKVFDVAIVWPLNESFATGPIFNNIDLFEQVETDIEYGVYFSGVDEQATMIYKQTLYDYIDAAPNNLLWSLISLICEDIGIKFDKTQLKNELEKIHWK